MKSVVKSVDVNVPVETAYNQWTQFEEFPVFMKNVKEVEQIDDTHMHWTAEIGGKKEQWAAEVTEQLPDQRIAWKATSGLKQAGIVTFHRLNDNESRVTLQMEYEPDSTTEKIGDALGMTESGVEDDLENFKSFIESRGAESGGWRGRVEAPRQS